jgi:hypothetical protein
MTILRYEPRAGVAVERAEAAIDAAYQRVADAYAPTGDGPERLLRILRSLDIADLSRPEL